MAGFFVITINVPDFKEEEEEEEEEEAKKKKRSGRQFFYNENKNLNPNPNPLLLIRFLQNQLNISIVAGYRNFGLVRIEFYLF